MSKLEGFAIFGTLGLLAAAGIVMVVGHSRSQTDDYAIFFGPSKMSLLSLPDDPDIDPGLPEGVKQAHHSTGMVIAPSSIGSTIYLGYNLWVTNRHVVGRDSTVQIRLANGSTIPGKVICVNPSQGRRPNSIDPSDLALIETDDPGVPPIKMATQMPKVGDPIYSNGSPYGQPEVIRGSEVTDVEEVVVIGPGAVDPGNSGGALLDEDGYMAGVVTFKGPDGSGVAIGTPLIRQMLQTVADGQICNG